MERTTMARAVLVWLVLAVVVIGSAEGGPARLDLMHKFSSKARDAMRTRYGAEFAADWPAAGTIEFQTMLRDHDVARHGHTERRMLAAQQQQYTFAQGNETEQLFGGGLHYAFIEIGTPSVQFLVVLDTGSDLLWIPCECVSCALLSAPSKDPRTTKLNAYTPSASSTAMPILCSDPLCDLSNTCAALSDQCPYEIKYVSANTSTSGTLYQDNLYFLPEAGGSVASLPIYLGCGKMQTGSLLKGAAPDGLMGLGMADISVPNKLATTGAMPDSFTMCISPDGSGRITFGDKGLLGQASTPIVPLSASGYQTYIVEISTVTVGGTSVPMASQALFDTGTSFTYLSKTAYPQFVQAYQQQMTLPPYVFNNWDLCFQTSDTNFQVPVITLSFSGGSTLDVVSGLKSVVDASNTMVAVCLTVMDSGGDLSIIGQNFMTNYSIAYDRADMTIGWTASDCYTDLTPSLPAATTPATAPSTSPSPTLAPSSPPTTTPTPPAQSSPLPPKMTTTPPASAPTPAPPVATNPPSARFPFGGAAAVYPSTMLPLFFTSLSLFLALVM